MTPPSTSKRGGSQGSPSSGQGWQRGQRDDLTLPEAAHVLWERRAVVVGCTLFFLVVALLYSLSREPVYEAEVKVYGQVSLLGELFCPCFELSSDGETLNVWYDLMVAGDGTVRPAVSVDGIDNGDWVVVTGELQRPETAAAVQQFWASEITKKE